MFFTLEYRKARWRLECGKGLLPLPGNQDTGTRGSPVDRRSPLADDDREFRAPAFHWSEALR